uniref:G_PROTEIN_RECEP_F1_2 domain-containing protein n=1 Tax=Thelazia callipaeda TaxID=103827 RepID=A0A0N5D3X5_THECL
LRINIRYIFTHEKSCKSKLFYLEPARIISNWQKSFLDFNSQPTNTCRRRNKIIPITSKIRDRHLQLEPLCCVSSCLVRCGCTAVAVFEYIYVGLTLIAIILRLFKNGCFVFWSPIKMSYDSVLTHAYFAYVLLGYDLITLAMSTALLHALTNFDKQILRLHLYFDYFALIFNTVLLLILLPALILQKSELRTFSNTLMAFCLLSQIPLQIWAITVVRSCLQFFVLVHVLVRLAEK